MFPSPQDSCHRLGMGGIPGEVICQQYGIERDDIVKLKMVIDQLVVSFPVLLIKAMHAFILLDYTGLLFRPGLAHELITLDQTLHQVQLKTPTLKKSYQTERGSSITQSLVLPLWRRDMLTVIMDFI